MSASFDPERPPPPPGQGYYPNNPQPQSHQHHYQPPRRHRGSLDNRSISPRSTQYSPSRDPRPTDHHDPRAPPFDPRRSSQVSHDDLEAQNQLAPYDEEKAYAEWCRAYGPEPAASTFSPTPSHSQVPAPTPVPAPSARRYSRQTSVDERRRYYDDDDVEPYYEDRSVERRSAPRRRRRRDSSHSVTDYASKPESNNVKDLGPTLLSSAAGAFLGRKLVGKGALGMVGGAIAGAIGANAGEQLDARKRRRQQQQREERLREERYLDREEDDRRRRRRRSRRGGYERQSPSPPPPGLRRDTAPPSPRHRDEERPYRPRRKRYVGSSPEAGYTSV